METLVVSGIGCAAVVAGAHFIEKFAHRRELARRRARRSTPVVKKFDGTSEGA